MLILSFFVEIEGISKTERSLIDLGLNRVRETVPDAQLRGRDGSYVKGDALGLRW